MKFLYDFIAVIAFVAALPYFIIRLCREKGFGERLKQQYFGFVSAEAVAAVAGKGCIWLHAASVGEIVATSPIVKEIRKQMPESVILISVVTTSGYAMANRIISEADAIIYFPLDLPWLAPKVLSRIKPRIFLPVETELWPNFLYAAKKMNIPVMLVNGRISDKSVKSYKYLRSILKDMLATFEKYCMQSTVDAQYIISLGADPRKVIVTGNTKFDQTYTDVSDVEKLALKKELGFEQRQPIIVAGSTHDDEEDLLFAAYNEAKAFFPELGMVIAPRNILRSDELIDLAAKYKLRAATRKKMSPGSTEHDIVILDTIGELGRTYSIGDVIYVGGSLIPHGGHNILEPAAHGKAIIVGPHMFNFKDSYALLSERGACDTVYDGTDLTQRVIAILKDDKTRLEMGERALSLIVSNRGAAEKSVNYLRQMLAQD